MNPRIPPASTRNVFLAARTIPRGPVPISHPRCADPSLTLSLCRGCVLQVVGKGGFGKVRHSASLSLSTSPLLPLVGLLASSAGDCLLISAVPLHIYLHYFLFSFFPLRQVNAITKLDTGELMALKRMEKYAVLQSSSHLKMVWVERKIMSLTSSPFLCNLLYAFESDKELFLVMPFMQGGDLRYHLREHGPLAEAHVKFYAAELLCALADLHAKRVVFRDLKPDNILLDDQGHLRLR